MVRVFKGIGWGIQGLNFPPLYIYSGEGPMSQVSRGSLTS